MKSTNRRCIRAMSGLLLVAAILSLLSPALAESDAGEEGLSSLLSGYMQQKRLNGDNISIAYCNTVSGEEYLWNSDVYYNAASIYKLPLNMYYYEQEAAGNISSDKKFAGIPLSMCHQLSLQYSHNPTSQSMRSALGTVRQYKTLMAKYGGVPAEELPDTYYNSGKYATGFILNTLKYLYDNQELFSEAIQYLKDAHPGRWFEKSLPDSECTVAQKYGWTNSDRVYTHTAGIVYADEPFLLVVFTKNIPYGETVIGDVARICYDYTQANAGTWRENVLHFKDVYTTDWYADAVAYCVENGVVSGTTDTTFSPDEAITRGQFITTIGRWFEGRYGAGCIEEDSQYANTGKFGDVPDDRYYTRYIYWADACDIITGATDTAFYPDAPITREDAAAMLFNYSLVWGESCLSVENENPTPFRDASQIADYARDAVEALQLAGVLKGDDAGCFNPGSGMKRSEYAALFARYMRSFVR